MFSFIKTLWCTTNISITMCALFDEIKGISEYLIREDISLSLLPLFLFLRIGCQVKLWVLQSCAGCGCQHQILVQGMLKTQAFLLKVQGQKSICKKFGTHLMYSAPLLNRCPLSFKQCFYIIDIKLPRVPNIITWNPDLPSRRHMVSLLPLVDDIDEPVVGGMKGKGGERFVQQLPDVASCQISWRLATSGRGVGVVILKPPLGNLPHRWAIKGRLQLPQEMAKAESLQPQAGRPCASLLRRAR